MLASSPSVKRCQAKLTGRPLLILGFGTRSKTKLLQNCVAQGVSVASVLTRLLTKPGSFELNSLLPIPRLTLMWIFAPPRSIHQGAEHGDTLLGALNLCGGLSDLCPV